MQDGTSQLLDADMFELFANPVTSHKFQALEIADNAHNFCSDCGAALGIVGIEYHCGECGQVMYNDAAGEVDKESSGGRIRINTGANKGKYRNVNHDYAKTQKKNIIDQLQLLFNQYRGEKFPYGIFDTIAEQYNNIQKIIKDCCERGDVISRKYVRRGDMKDEILAALLYFECIRDGEPRKRGEISLFMKLYTQGFARGEGTLRDLEADGLINLPEESADDNITKYVRRYFNALHIAVPRYNEFVIALVKHSLEARVGIGSQVPSRIVGAMWIVINRCKLGISDADLERATDNTKKSTFKKFSTFVITNMSLFEAIFTKYSVPVA